MDTEPARLTDRDRAILAFAAEHRLVLQTQAERLLGVEEGLASERLGELTASEYLSAGRVLGDLHYQIRPLGLTAIDSDLPPPKFKLGAYKHDVGLAWLWLAAKRGMFGPLAEVISERRLRSHDGALERAEEPYGVRFGGVDRYGRERLHYPDLLLVDPCGRRLALELELTRKGHERRELILGGYGADPRIDRVLYLVEDQPAGRSIKRTLEAATGEMGLSDRIRFQLIKPFCVAADRLGQATARAGFARQPAEAGR